MELVDKLVCVGCHTVSFQKARGKFPRVLNVACDKCQPSLFEVKGDVSKAHESGRKPS